MAQLLNDFVDSTIPGLGGRGLLKRAVQAVQSRCAEAAESYACWRQDRALRKDLARLDLRLLRDIGLDRDAS